MKPLFGKFLLLAGVSSGALAQTPPDIPELTEAAMTQNIAPQTDEYEDGFTTIEANVNRSLVNPFTGSVQFSLGLVGITNSNGISYDLTLGYSGANIAALDRQWRRFHQTSWVGQGFDIPIPKIIANKHELASLENDEYYIQIPGTANGRLLRVAANQFVLEAKNGITLERVLIGGDIDYWILRDLRGATYEFGKSGGQCNPGVPAATATEWERCQETYGGYITYLPGQYLQDHANPALVRPKTFTTDEWYLRRIVDRRNAFSLFFKYDDYHLQDIYALNGTAEDLSAGNVVRRLHVNLEAKSAQEFHVNNRNNRFFRSESKRIKSIDYFEGADLKRKLEFGYALTPNGNTRLEGVQERVPFNAGSASLLSRRLYGFGYETAPGNGAVLKTLTDREGAITEFGYANVASTAPKFGSVAFDLRNLHVSAANPNFNALNIPGLEITNEEVFFAEQIGRKFYLGVHKKDVTQNVCNYHYPSYPRCEFSQNGQIMETKDYDKSKEKILVEFTHSGGSYKLSRLFKPFAADSIQFSMAPDGSYFVWASDDHVKIWDLRKEDVPDAHIIVEPNDAVYPPAASFDYTGLNNRKFYPVLLQDWFAIVDDSLQVRESNKDRSGQKIRFFGKHEGQWVPLTCGPEVLASKLATFTYRDSFDPHPEPKSGCLDFQEEPNLGQDGIDWVGISAQRGNNFLVVTHHTMANYNSGPSLWTVMHVYMKEGNRIVEKALPKDAGGNPVNTKSYTKLFDSHERFFVPRSGEGYRNLLNVYREYFSNYEGEGGTPWLSCDYPNTSGNTDICSSVFPSMHSISVNGNLVGLSAMSHERSNHQRRLFLYAAFDGEDWQYVNDRFTDESFQSPISLGKVMAGPYYFLDKATRPDDAHVAKPIWFTGLDMRSTGVAIPATHRQVFRTHPIRHGLLAVKTGEDFIAQEWFADSLSLNHIGLFVKREDYRSLSSAANPSQLSFIGNSASLPLSVIALKDQAGADIIAQNIQFLGDLVILRSAADNKYKYSRIPPGGFAGSQLTFKDIPASLNQTCRPLTGGVFCYDYNGHATFINLIEHEVHSGSNLVNLVTSVTHYSKGLADSKAGDGSKYTTSFSYDPAQLHYNAFQGRPNVGKVEISTPESHARLEYHLDLAPVYDRGAEFLGGNVKKSRFARTAAEVQADARGSESVYDTKVITENGVKRYQGRKLRTAKTEQFWDYGKTLDTYNTFFDAGNERAKISIRRTGGEYDLAVTRYAHEFGTAAAPFTSVVQTARYVFTSDPCGAAAPDAADPDPKDRCSNIYADNLAFLKTAANSKRAMSSNIFTYDPATRLPLEAYEWRPVKSGVTPLSTLEADLGQGVWRKKSTVASRAFANPWAKAKSQEPIQTESENITTTRFLGGIRGDVLATVSNSGLSSSAILTGEEDNANPDPVNIPQKLGAYGRWTVPAGTGLDAQVAHTGSRSAKVTAQSGPTIDLPLGGDAAFLAKKKGMVISLWVLASTGSNPMARVDILSAPGATPVPFVDVVQKHVEKTGLPFPENKWVKVEHLVSQKELEQLGFYSTGTMIFRFWAGKASSANANPVYLDDIRLHPSDAVVGSANFDAAGRVTSVLDGNNEPTYPKHNVWMEAYSAKSKKGLAYTTSASRRIGED